MTSGIVKDKRTGWPFTVLQRSTKKGKRSDESAEMAPCNSPLPSTRVPTEQKFSSIRTTPHFFKAIELNIKQTGDAAAAGVKRVFPRTRNRLADDTEKIESAEHDIANPDLIATSVLFVIAHTLLLSTATPELPEMASPPFCPISVAFAINH